jgi:hypothetical protein
MTDWELHNDDDLNLDIGRSIAGGVGRNIFFYGSKEATRRMRKSHRPQRIVAGDVTTPSAAICQIPSLPFNAKLIPSLPFMRN